MPPNIDGNGIFTPILAYRRIADYVLACNSVQQASLREDAMRRDLGELTRLILEAVSEDCVPLEAVVSNVLERQVGASTIFESALIESTLLSSIADKYVAAYLLHAESPYVTAVEANSDTIGRYWFYITEKGVEYLQVLIQKEAHCSHRIRRCVTFRLAQTGRRPPALRH